MKKKLTILIFMLFLASLMFADITIGDGTVVGKAIPIEPYFGYTYSQVIYLQSEIGVADDITTLSWNFAGTSLSSSNDWTIYMGHTTKTDFSSTTDWVDVTTLTQVWTGTFTDPGAAGWVSFDITDFTYNNTDNLIIAVDENASGYNGSGDDFYCTGVTGNRAITYRNDSTNPDPLTPPAASYTYPNIANIVLGGITQACPAPNALTSGSITATSASLGWTDNASASAWNIELGATGFTPTGTPTQTGVTNPYTYTGLAAATTYDWYVQTDCGTDEVSAWVGPNTFTTDCTVISTFPFTEDFDGTWSGDPAAPLCWSVVNNDADGYTWNQGNSYITAHSGTWVAQGMGSNDDYLISPELDLSGDYRLKWWDIVESASNNNTYDILISTTTNDIASFTNNLGTFDCTNTTWTEHILSLDSYNGQTVFIAFHQTYSAATYYGFGIDDVTIELIPSCLAPSSLIASNITASGADLGWTENNTPAVSLWNIEYGLSGFTQGAGTTVTGTTTNPHSLSGLTADTTYDWYVQTDCTTDEASVWVGPNTFTTEQTPAVTQTFPFAETWETQTLGPNWNYYAVAPSILQISATALNTGSYGLEQYGDNSTYTTPAGLADAYTKAVPGGVNDDHTTWNKMTIDLTSAVAPRLTFSYAMGYQYNDNYNNFWVQIDSGSGWVDIFSTQTAGSATAYTEQIVDIISYAGGIVDLRFFHNGKYATNYLYLDDISIIEGPSCLEPSVQTVANITATGADLGWTENNSPAATLWNIELGETGFIPTGTPTATGVTNPYTYTGLTAETTYDWYVQADCGTDVASAWTGPNTFTTACATLTLPFTEDFENAGVTPDCWTNSSSTGEVWQFTTSGIGHSATADHTTGTGYFAVVDDSESPHSTDVTLTTPFIDVSSYTNPGLTFWLYSDNEGYANMTLRINVWDGASWNNDYATYSGNTTGWEEKIVNLVGVTITGPIQIQFVADETSSGTGWYDDIAIDDIGFTDIIAGALTGNVSELLPAEAVIVGAEITISGLTGITDSFGDYTINGIAVGTYDVTCTATGYIPETVTGIVISDGVTTTQDFELGWAECAVSPSNISTTLNSGASDTSFFTITNDGTADLTYECSIDLNPPVDRITRIPRSNGDFMKGVNPLSSGLVPKNVIAVEKAPIKPNNINNTDGFLAYGVDASHTQFTSFDVDIPEVVTNIAPEASTTSFANAGDFPLGVDSYILSLDNENTFGRYDIATGAFTQIAIADPLITGGATGMATDPTDGTVYVCNGSELFTINPTTGATTSISTMGNGGGLMIDICVDGSGNMWGFDISDDIFYSINKTTGAATAVGSIGFDANYGQGMTWDSTTDRILLSAYNNTSATSELRVADRATGNTSLIGVLGATTPGTVCQYGWIAIPYRSWLAITSNTMGTVPGGGLVQVDIAFDATGLSGVVKDANIVIEHNGQNIFDETQTVAVQLTVNAVSTPPDPATNPVPESTSTDVDLLLTLSWTNNGVVDSTLVQYKENPQQLVWTTADTLYGAASVYTFPSELEYSNLYTWRVLNYNVAGASTPTSWTFTTIPAAAANPTPADNAVDILTDATLDWDDVAYSDSFYVYVWYDNGITDAPVYVVDGEFTAVSNYDPVDDYDFETEYFWKIETYRDDTLEGTSATWSFTTVTEIPLTPSNPVPADDAVNVSAFALTLEWSCVNGTAFDVYLDPVSGDEPTTLIADDITTSFYALPSDLDWSTEYEWKVEASNAVGTTMGPVWSFTTESPAVAPFTEDFEGSTDTWTIDGTNSSWEVAAPTALGDFVERTISQNRNGKKGKDPTDTGNLDPAAAHGGTKCAGNDLTVDGMYNASEASYLVTPSIDCSAFTNVQLSFWRYLNVEQDWDEVYVEVTNDGTTWNDLGHPLYVQETGWIEITLNASTYATGNVVQFRWRLDSDSSVQYTGWNIDDVEVWESQCVNPSAQTVANIESTSADLGWTENGTATAWEIELGATGFTPTGTGTSVSANPYTYGGLAANTTYDWYVRTDCGASQSDWVGPNTFTTECAANTTYPWTEDFEGTFLPDCWSKIVYTGNDITQSSTQNHTDSGMYSARFSSYSSADDYNQYLFGAPLDLTGLSNPELSFWHRKYGNYAETLEWGVSTTKDPLDFTWTPVTLSNTEWNNTVVDLSAWIGQTVYIGFHYYGNYLYYVYLDDVEVVDATISSPENVLISIDASANTVLSWNAVIGANRYHVYGCDTPDGSFVDVSSSGTFTAESWTSTSSMGDIKFFQVTADTITAPDSIGRKNSISPAERDRLRSKKSGNQIKK